jgi:DNA-binding transcriptional MerR regulator
VIDKLLLRNKAYTTAEAAELGGVAYPTLGYLNAKDILKPSIRVSGHQGAANLYSFADIVALRSISALRKVPAALGTLRGVVDFWKSADGLAVVAGGAPGKMLVVSPEGAAKLEEGKDLLALTSKHRVLHLVDAEALVEDLIVGAAEALHEDREPKRRGRPPGRHKPETERPRGGERRTRRERFETGSGSGKKKERTK